MGLNSSISRWEEGRVFGNWEQGERERERERESFEVCSRTREGLTKFGEENQTQRNEQQWFERWRRHTKFTLTFYDHINRTNSQLVIFNLFKKKKKKKIMIFNILLCEVAVTVSVLIHSQWSFKSFFTSLSLCIDSQIVIFGVLNETFRIFFFNEETFRIWQPQVWLTSYFFNQRFFFILNKQ